MVKTLAGALIIGLISLLLTPLSVDAAGKKSTNPRGITVIVAAMVVEEGNHHLQLILARA